MAGYRSQRSSGLIKRHTCVGFALVCLYSLSVTAQAVGLGGVSVASYLGEPLRAQLTLASISDVAFEEIRVGPASDAEFARFGIDKALLPADLQFTLRSDAAGTRVLLSTSAPIERSRLELVIEAMWSGGRVLQQYSIVLDERVAVEKTGHRPEQQHSVFTSRSGPTDPPGSHLGGAGSEELYSGGAHLVTTMDTLWRIASLARPDGVSIEQVMIETLRINPSAFRDANINGLKAGYILRLPEREDIRIGLSAAIMSVAQQNQRWLARTFLPHGAQNNVAVAAKPVAPADRPGASETALTETGVAGNVPGVGAVNDNAVSVTSERALIRKQLESLVEKVEQIESSLRQIEVRLLTQDGQLQDMVEKLSRQRLEPGSAGNDPDGGAQSNAVNAHAGWLLAAGLLGLNLGALGALLYARRKFAEANKRDSRGLGDVPQSETEERQGEGSGSQESTDSIFGAETDPVDSKLDLARAYLDMGDVERARPVLMEVMGEGSESQRREALTLLRRLENS